MVLEAGDHQKTQEDIDFMLINGLIIILQAGKTKLLIFTKCRKRPERTLKRSSSKNGAISTKNH